MEPICGIRRVSEAEQQGIASIVALHNQSIVVYPQLATWYSSGEADENLLQLLCSMEHRRGRDGLEQTVVTRLID